MSFERLTKMNQIDSG